MSGLHLRKIICQAANNGRCYLGRHFGLPSRWFKVTPLKPLNSITWTRNGPAVIHVKTYTTTEQEDEPVENPSKKKKVDPTARKTIGSVGRKIPYRFIHVLNDNGEDLGNMHRADVIRMMDEQGLKLVPVRENADPPVYKLLTGKQIHDEQVKLREKQKLATSHGPVQIKELSFSALIGKHDLDTKMKQVMHWIEKKHHVRITVQKGSSVEGTDRLDLLDQIANTMSEYATCVFKPKLIKEGRAAVCVLRPWSEKELREKKKANEQQPLTDLSQKDTAKTEDAL